MQELLTEKYRPFNFKELSFNHENNEKLQNLIASESIPHMIFYGQSGVGKKTRINCVLGQIYGEQTIRTQKDTYRVKHKGKTIEIGIRYSKYHIEIQPSDAGTMDNVVLTQFLKHTATNQSVLEMNKKCSFITIVIVNANQLTHAAQAALRRNLEKYSQKLRVILVCNSTGNIIPAIKSRCLLLKFRAPSDKEMEEILIKIAKEEKFYNDNVNKLIHQIVIQANSNLRKAILDLQNKMLHNDMSPDNLQYRWQQVIAQDIIEPLAKSQNINTVKEIRKNLYLLLANNVPAKTIIKEILINVTQGIKDRDLIIKAKEAAVQIDSEIQQKSKEIIYLESLIVKLALILRQVR